MKKRDIAGYRNLYSPSNQRRDACLSKSLREELALDSEDIVDGSFNKVVSEAFFVDDCFLLFRALKSIA